MFNYRFVKLIINSLPDTANGGASGAENTVRLVRYPENLTQSGKL